MNEAYVLINSEKRLEIELLENLKSLPNVKDVHKIYGVYDFAVRVKGDDGISLKDSIIQKLKQIEGVRSTLTLLIL